MTTTSALAANGFNLFTFPTPTQRLSSNFETKNNAPPAQANSAFYKILATQLSLRASSQTRQLSAVEPGS
ncbi:MAG: hypothetical protein AAFZ17_21385 [Cyanobacteria bacterium J06650_10]